MLINSVFVLHTCAMFCFLQTMLSSSTFLLIDNQLTALSVSNWSTSCQTSAFSTWLKDWECFRLSYDGRMMDRVWPRRCFIVLILLGNIWKCVFLSMCPSFWGEQHNLKKIAFLLSSLLHTSPFLLLLLGEGDCTRSVTHPGFVYNNPQSIISKQSSLFWPQAACGR